MQPFSLAVCKSVSITICTVAEMLWTYIVSFAVRCINILDVVGFGGRGVE